MTQIWIDPDAPEALFRHHRLWSTTRPAPVRFRRRDLLDGTDTPLGQRIRRRLADGIGRAVDGPLRTLTQPRVWGWVFNPLTVHLTWDDEGSGQPSAALLEVTNTPWKERHCYAIALEPAPTGLRARFDKALHVSPFLDLDWTYELRLTRRDTPMPTATTSTSTRTSTGSADRLDPSTVLDLALDVLPTAQPTSGQPTSGADEPILSTRLTTRLLPAGGRAATSAMSATLRPDRLPTHRVSAGIHAQALRLWRKRVPFVPHPDRRS